MKKKLIIWGVVLLTAINVAALTTSAYNHWDRDDSSRREHRREGRSSWEEWLGLSASQSEQMKVQHEVLVEKIRPLRDVMQGKRDHFYELVMVTAPDRAAIDRVQDEMDSLQADIKRLVIDNMLAQKEILTPEQQSQFFNLIKKQYGNGNYRRN